MNSSDAQKSEVHDTTADADGSPTADGDEATTVRGAHGKAPTGDRSHFNPPPLTAGTHIVRDETDVGGPLVIESDDPELNPPHVPIDPFPTDGTPEIDPPVER